MAFDPAIWNTQIAGRPDATQALANLQPTQGSINGLISRMFDGVNDVMEITAQSYVAMTLMIVFERNHLVDYVLLGDAGVNKLRLDASGTSVTITVNSTDLVFAFPSIKVDVSQLLTVTRTAGRYDADVCQWG